jgi:hypothetical protein
MVLTSLQMEHAALSSVTFYLYIWSWVFLAIFVLVSEGPIPPILIEHASKLAAQYPVRVLFVPRLLSSRCNLTISIVLSVFS